MVLLCVAVVFVVKGAFSSRNPPPNRLSCRRRRDENSPPGDDDDDDDALLLMLLLLCLKALGVAVRPEEKKALKLSLVPHKRDEQKVPALIVLLINTLLL